MVGGTRFRSVLARKFVARELFGGSPRILGEMPLRMRSWPVLVCLGLALGCSSSDDGATGALGGASAGNQAGNANQAGGSNSSSAGTDSGGGNQAGGGGRLGGTSGTSGTGGANASGSSGSSSKAGAAGTTSTAGSAGSGTNPNDPYGDARTRCVDRTNELRATKGLGPIPRLAKAEPCADGQAKADSESGKAHSAFNACLDQVKWKGAGQNECPGYGSVEETLKGCLDMMWAEGPGGGHYDNMVGDSTHTACGIYTTPAGKVWLVQDFWTE